MRNLGFKNLKVSPLNNSVARGISISFNFDIPSNEIRISLQGELFSEDGGGSFVFFMKGPSGKIERRGPYMVRSRFRFTRVVSIGVISLALLFKWWAPLIFWQLNI